VTVPFGAAPVIFTSTVLPTSIAVHPAKFFPYAHQTIGSQRPAVEKHFPQYELKHSKIMSTLSLSKSRLKYYQTYDVDTSTLACHRASEFPIDPTERHC